MFPIAWSSVIFNFLVVHVIQIELFCLYHQLSCVFTCVGLHISEIHERQKGRERGGRLNIHEGVQACVDCKAGPADMCLMYTQAQN